MEVTIQINDPVLIAGEHFNVSYRELPSGTPIDISPKTNAPFTITGLTEGDYELTVIYVNEDGNLCPAVITPFVVTEDDPPPPDAVCNCNPISQLWVLKKCDNTSLVHLEFDGLALGVCSYDITHTGFNNSNSQVSHYTSSNLPPVIEYVLPTNAGVAPYIKIVENCCNGAVMTCFEGNITDIRNENCDDPCEAPVITDAWINYDDVADVYKVCVNFTSTLLSPPYDVAYVQQNVASPDHGTNVETTLGYFEYTVDPTAFTGDLVYHVTVGNECGFDLKVIGIAKCDQLITFSGGESFPYERTVQISPCTPLEFVYNSSNVPSKAIISVGGTDELDTGYNGSTSYQALLDAAISPDPPEAITQNVGTSVYSFNNPSGTGYAQVSVYSPLPNTAFSFFVKCRACPPTGNRITLIVENTAGSNVETVSVHGNSPYSITFSPYQPENNIQTFYNVEGWIGAVSAGVYLHPVNTRSKTYKVQVYQNASLILTETFSYSGGSTFHIGTILSGIVANDTIRIVISST